jgi:hypothetical protein
MLCALSVWVAACGARTGTRPRAAKPAAAMAAAPGAAEPSLSWASHVGQPVLPKQAPTAKETKVEPATLVDNEYANAELVPVRHLVYRVTLILPGGLHTHRPAIAGPAGELHLDVGDQRLRARFVGPGWPIDEGSEVRLRSDVPGVYLFDSAGGRPLPPGQLASWFQGEAGLRARTDVRLRHDVGDPNEGPGDLLCAFLAEWSQIAREDMLPRCAGTLPPGFRLGIFSAELTAILPLNLARKHLRADAVEPPTPALAAPVRQLLEARDIERILPTPVRLAKGDTAAVAVDAAVSGDGIWVDNRTPARLLVVVQGLPIGWVKPQTSGRFAGLSPGYYRIAVLRPSGLFVMPPALTRVPVDLHFGGPGGQGPPVVTSAQLKEPEPISPEAAR